jgi:hypothetical protein
MRYLKILGFTAAAAAALAATVGAGGASATVLCSTTVELCPEAQKWQAGTVLDWTVPAGGAIAVNDTSGNQLDKCTVQTKKWKITAFGSATATVTGVEEATTWENCTFPTKMLTLPKWEVHKIAGTSNGTVTADAADEMTINTVFFGSCIYGASAGSSIGEITEGDPAVLHTNAVTTRFGTNFACPSTSRLSGTLTLTTPVTTLSVASG